MAKSPEHPGGPGSDLLTQLGLAELAGQYAKDLDEAYKRAIKLGTALDAAGDEIIGKSGQR